MTTHRRAFEGQGTHTPHTAHRSAPHTACPRPARARTHAQRRQVHAQEGARPRSTAPHKAAVLAKLKELTTPVHSEEKAAEWPSLGAPLQAAHFIYVGKTAA